MQHKPHSGMYSFRIFYSMHATPYQTLETCCGLQGLLPLFHLPDLHTAEISDLVLIKNAADLM